MCGAVWLGSEIELAMLLSAIAKKYSGNSQEIFTDHITLLIQLFMNFFQWETFFSANFRITQHRSSGQFLFCRTQLRNYCLDIFLNVYA